jgi:hypothetical protein
MRRKHLRVNRRTTIIATITLLAGTSALGATAGPAKATAYPTMQIAYEASNGELYETGGGAAPVDVGFAVKTGTNPSVADEPGVTSFPPPGVTPALPPDQFAAQSPTPDNTDGLFISPWPFADEGDGAEGYVYDDLGEAPAPGTSPSVTWNAPETDVSEAQGTYAFYYVGALNSNSGTLGHPNEVEVWEDDPSLGHLAIYYPGLSIAPQTSPAVTTDANNQVVANPSPETGYTYDQASVGELAFEGGGTGNVANDLYTSNWGAWSYQDGADEQTVPLNGVKDASDAGVAMAPDTSPSVTGYNYNTDAYGFATAVQNSLGDAEVFVEAGGDAYSYHVDTGQEMAGGTSPSIAYDGTATAHSSANPNAAEHLVVAFQGAPPNSNSTGDLKLWNGGSETTFDTGFRMAAGTSPSMTYNASTGIYTIAFQGSDFNLWTYTYTYNLTNGRSSGTATDTGIPMAPGEDSPAIGTSPAENTSS